MSRFYNYPEAESLQSDDVFLIDGETDGTRKIPANKMADFFGEQVPTDKTLAVTNMAADAKVVGDEIGEIKSALELSETYEALVLTKTAGGFSGAIGEAITFNTQSAWQKKTFSPQENTKYKITFYNRKNISARAYIYAVDSEGIILYQYGQMPAQQSAYELQECITTFPSDVYAVWVCGANAEGASTITVSKAVLSSAIDSIESDIDDIKEIVMPESVYDKGPFNTHKFDFGGFYKGHNTDYSGFGSSTKYADIITAFDALMAMDTTHITKTSLGTASGTDAGGNQYTLYEYAFAPHSYKGNLTVNKNPVFLLDGCIHGFEKNSTFGLYYFLYDLVNNYYDDPVLTALRDNVVIKIIPVVNPYGFDNNTYTNGNNVNINRNFATSDWESVVDSGSDNSGLEPFDQPESAIIRDWINDNIDNVIAYYNCHTNGRYVTAYSDMNSVMPKFGRVNNDAYYYRLNDVTQKHIQRQTAYFQKMYNGLADIPQNLFVGKYQTETGAFGMASVWASEQAKIPSMTFEVFIGIRIDGTYIIEQFSDESKKISSEMIGNIVAETVFEYSDC